MNLHQIFLFYKVTAKGFGMWKDPKYYKGDDSIAGIRVVAEYPAHTLTLVGTNDGVVWFMQKGVCSGKGMTKITLNGVTGDLVGWGTPAQSILWPDGTSWSSMKPTAAFTTAQPPTFHGLFVDPHHVRPPAGPAPRLCRVHFPPAHAL